MLQRKVTHRTELSRLCYSSCGIILAWDHLGLVIPYEQLQLTSNPYLLLDEFKQELNGVLTIFLRFRLITGGLEDVEVEQGDEAIKELAEVVSRIEQLANEVKSGAATRALTLPQAKAIFDKQGFSFPDSKVNIIVSKIIADIPVQTVDRSIAVPLSQLQYSNDAVAYFDGSTSLKVENKLLKFGSRAIFESIKGQIEGSIVFKLRSNCLLKWDHSTSSLLVGQVGDVALIGTQIEPDTLKAFKTLRCNEVCRLFPPSGDKPIERLGQLLKEWGLDPTDGDVGKQIDSCILTWTELVKTVTSRAVTGALTLPEAKAIFDKQGFSFPDSKVNIIVSKIIADIPVQTVDKTISVPLSQLQYSDDAVAYFDGNTSLKIENKLLKFESRAIFESIKGQIEGNIVFKLRSNCLLKWDHSTSSLLVGQVGDVALIGTQIEPDTLKAFKTLRCNEVCRLFPPSGDKPIERLGQLLKEWGLDPPDDDVGKQIESGILPWTMKAEDFRVALDSVDYEDSRIVVTAGAERIGIPSSVLPFTPIEAANLIKDTFKGEIGFRLARSDKFVWNSNSVNVEMSKLLVSSVELDPEAIEMLKKVRSVWIDINKRFDPNDGYAPNPRDLFRITFHSVQIVPADYQVPKDYNRECIKILEGLAAAVYPLPNNLWFKVGEYLVWERPIYGAATYIFKWPLNPLELPSLMSMIMNTKPLTSLLTTHRIESGYVHRVIHESGNRTIKDWEDDLRAKTRMRHGHIIVVPREAEQA